MAFLAPILGPSFVIINLIPWTVGVGIGIGCIYDHFGCDDTPKPRGLAHQRVRADMPMLFKWNETELRGKDIAQLNGLSISFGNWRDERALLSNEVFSSNGSFTLLDTTHGIRQGEVSFHIPGLDPPVQGLWIALDHERADENTTVAFERMHMAVKEARERDEMSMIDGFEKVARSLQP